MRIFNITRTLVASVIAAMIALSMFSLPTDADAAQLNPGDTATIKWTSDGLISSIGPLRKLHRSQMTPGRATRLLGPAKVRTNRYGDSCKMTWKRLGLRLTFATFGQAKPYRCPKLLQTAGVFYGSSVNWQTSNGLALGAPRSMIDMLFPEWYVSENLSADQPVLIDHFFGYGDGPNATLWATISSEDTVSKFNLYVGQAGD